MTEPTTPLKALIIPNTGDLVGAWGTAAVNVDWTAVDSMLGGVQTISLSSATTFSLSAPAGSITPGAGPNQAQNAVLKFTGTLSGNAVITLPLPGFYIVKNNCTVGTNYVQFRAVGTGNLIGIPDGRAVKIWTDGTDVDFCDQADPGTYLDLAMATTPSWYAGCSVLPWLICDGTIYTSSLYPVLSQRLGSTFGGNGITTFGVPDQQNRARIPLGGSSGRVTVAGSGINGTTLGATGGSQLLQQHNHTTTESPHTHPLHTNSELHGTGPGSFTYLDGAGGGSASSGSSTTGLSINNTGTGAAQNMPPVIVSGIALIKT